VLLPTPGLPVTPILKDLCLFKGNFDNALYTNDLSSLFLLSERVIACDRIFVSAFKTPFAISELERSFFGL